jgi:hypothetical protein
VKNYLLGISISLVLAGCIPPNAGYIEKNGVNMVVKHDEFKDETVYRSKPLDVETPTNLFGGHSVSIMFYRLESDTKKFPASEWYSIGLYGEGWCFISKNDEVNFLADGDKLTMNADSDSDRNVIMGDSISEIAHYTLTAKAKKYFAKHLNQKIRFQVEGQRCKQEGAISESGTVIVNNFFNAFSGGPIVAEPTPEPQRPTKMK